MILVPVQLLLLAFAMRGFAQKWNVEVEVSSDAPGGYAPDAAAHRSRPARSPAAAYTCPPAAVLER